MKFRRDFLAANTMPVAAFAHSTSFPRCLIAIDNVALEKTDCRYPDAIELEDGRVPVAYYAGRVSAHQRYRMGIVQVLLNELS